MQFQEGNADDHEVNGDRDAPEISNCVEHGNIVAAKVVDTGQFDCVLSATSDHRQVKAAGTMATPSSHYTGEIWRQTSTDTTVSRNPLSKVHSGDDHEKIRLVEKPGKMAEG